MCKVDNIDVRNDYILGSGVSMVQSIVTSHRSLDRLLLMAAMLSLLPYDVIITIRDYDVLSQGHKKTRPSDVTATSNVIFTCEPNLFSRLYV